MEKLCDVATGETTHNGYVRVQRVRDGKQVKVRAHREAWERENGPIPKGMYVLHRCDNRACREVSHLFLGTHQDNMDDMKRKGRTRKGTRNHKTVLPDETVAEIRRSDQPGVILAALFGVRPATISRIRNGLRR